MKFKRSLAVRLSACFVAVMMHAIGSDIASLSEQARLLVEKLGAVYGLGFLAEGMI